MSRGIRATSQILRGIHATNQVSPCDKPSVMTHEKYIQQVKFQEEYMHQLSVSHAITQMS